MLASLAVVLVSGSDGRCLDFKLRQVFETGKRKLVRRSIGSARNPSASDLIHIAPQQNQVHDRR